MQDHELTAWLGPAADEVTDEQRDRLHAASDRIDELYPGEDDQDEAQEAFSWAAQIILGDSTLEDARDHRVRARLALDTATAAVKGAIIAVASADIAPSERDMAQAAGVNRLTLRKALGK